MFSSLEVQCFNMYTRIYFGMNGFMLQVIHNSYFLFINTKSSFEFNPKILALFQCFVLRL